MESEHSKRRINRVIEFKDNIDELIDRIFSEFEDSSIDKLPLNDDMKSSLREAVEQGYIDQVRDLIQDTLMDNDELQDLIEGYKKSRPPRFILCGRTNSGKSALVNALCDRYVTAETAAEEGVGIEEYPCEVDGEILFEVIDTEGFSGVTEDGDQTAKEKLIQAVNERQPDALLFVTDITDTDNIEQDVGVLKEVREALGKQFQDQVPTIAVRTKADLLEPDHERKPEKFSEKKEENIKQALTKLESLLKKENIEPESTLAVSSKQIWEPYPDEVNKEEWPSLHRTDDYRYQIDKLIEILSNNIEFEAQCEFIQKRKIDLFLEKFCIKLSHAFAGAGATVASSPIPVADFIPLIVLEMMLVMVIAYIGGRELSVDSILELGKAFGIAGTAGFGFKYLVELSSSAAGPGIDWFGLGQAVAYGGVYSIGWISTRYFILGINDIEKVKGNFAENFEKAREYFYSSENKTQTLHR